MRENLSYRFIEHFLEILTLCAGLGTAFYFSSVARTGWTILFTKTWKKSLFPVRIIEYVYPAVFMIKPLLLGEII